jgi:hypothetical protein
LLLASRYGKFSSFEWLNFIPPRRPLPDTSNIYFTTQQRNFSTASTSAFLPDFNCHFGVQFCVPFRTGSTPTSNDRNASVRSRHPTLLFKLGNLPTTPIAACKKGNRKWTKHRATSKRGFEASGQLIPIPIAVFPMRTRSLGAV